MAEHLFALFSPSVLNAIAQMSGTAVHVSDEVVAHRVYRILRLRACDTVIFFDQMYTVHVVLLERPKKGLLLHVIKRTAISSPAYTLNVLLPLLKKDALDAAVYACVQAGVRQVSLVSTQRSHAIPKGAKVLDRLQKVSIAAAEQSKQFFLPSIVLKRSLNEALLEVSTSTRLVANPHGTSVLDVATGQLSESVTITVGPEGGFSAQEHELLQQHSFKACALTTSILKADQAIALLAYVTSIALER